jgi:hypothetical protein
MAVVKSLSDVKGEPRFFKKRPVKVRAVQLTEDMMVHTREGPLTGRAGDWVIEGVEGEVYPCDPEIFKKTYEEVSQ